MGLAKQLRSLDQLQNTYAGTPLNMAPEIIKREQYDYKADVWSLGTLLFQLLVGYTPFPANYESELVNKLSVGNYEIPSEANVSLECTNFI